MMASVKAHASGMLLLSLMLLGVAFFYGVSPVYDYGSVYRFLFQLFNWSLRIGGALLLIGAVLAMMGQSVALLLDAIISAACGASLAICAIGWTLFEKSVSLFNIIAGIIGFFLIKEAWAAWQAYRANGGAPRRQVSAVTADAPPVKISSSVLPDAGEAPPEEGYLAALAREKDDTPGANYE